MSRNRTADQNQKEASISVTGGWSRRDFLRRGGAATGLVILPRHVLGGRGYVAPSDTVNLAIIGTGGQGVVNIRGLFQEPDARIIAIADPTEQADYSPFYYRGTWGRLPALKLINDFNTKKNFKECVGYVDYREMFDKEKAIDAVLVATPDHAHAVTVMAALALKKHVYCEKPLCRTLWETRKIREAAKNAGVATQMGNHGHSGQGIRVTVEWLQGGAIGAVREVHSWATLIPWSQLHQRPKETVPVPSGMNWDLWLGPAPERPYHPEYAPVKWRSWWDFGTGHLGDFACHHLDPAFWGLKLTHPTNTEARTYAGSSETFPHASIVYFNFPAREGLPPVEMTWYDGGLGPETPPELEVGRRLAADHGILFVGDKGKMVCGGWGGSPRLIPETAMAAFKRPEPTIRRVKGHHRDWLDACKGGEPSSANFEAVGPMVESVLMGALSFKQPGQRLSWDGAELKCTNVEEINQYVRPTYRSGWSL